MPASISLNPSTSTPSSSPESFCARAVKRYALIWKASFQPGDVTVTEHPHGAELLVSGIPWAGDPGFQSALAGDLVSIPFYACLKGEARVEPAGRNALRVHLTWSKAR